MSAYYNEFDPFAAGWLRELIKAGHIAPGDVDERSIEDVHPSDLIGYTQCHFFAGIGVWSYALRLAGWPDDRPVWTGSCPCQPFSAAGKGEGTTDERHLWPAYFHLIQHRRPSVVFGEQVEAAIKHGWLDLVQDDLEGIDYSFGATGFPAASIGAPHIRQRLYFVADNNNKGLEGWGGMSERPSELAVGTGSVAGGLADTEHTEHTEWRTQHEKHCEAHGRDGLGRSSATDFWSGADWIYCRDEKYRPVEPGTFPLAHGATNRVGRLRGYGNAIVAPQAAEFILTYKEAKLMQEIML